MRHRFAVTNWLTAAYRTVQLVARHATHLGATLPKRVATGEVVAIGTNDLSHLGNAMDVTARATGAVVCVPRGRGDPAPDLDHAGPAGAGRRAAAAAADRPDPQAAAASQPDAARDDGRAVEPRDRHRQRAAGAARHRRRARLPRPLRPRLAEGAGGRRAGGPAAVAARRVPGAAARRLRGARRLARRAVRGAGPDHAGRARRVLRLRRVPDDPAAHRDRVRQQVDPRVRVRAPRRAGARAAARGHRPRPGLRRAAGRRRARRRRERPAGARTGGWSRWCRTGPRRPRRSPTGSAATPRARCAGATCR